MSQYRAFLEIARAAAHERAANEQQRKADGIPHYFKKSDDPDRVAWEREEAVAKGMRRAANASAYWAAKEFLDVANKAARDAKREVREARRARLKALGR